VREKLRNELIEGRSYRCGASGLLHVLLVRDAIWGKEAKDTPPSPFDVYVTLGRKIGIFSFLPYCIIDSMLGPILMLLCVQTYVPIASAGQQSGAAAGAIETLTARARSARETEPTFMIMTEILGKYLMR
jgi:hypothetical protein